MHKNHRYLLAGATIVLALAMLSCNLASSRSPASPTAPPASPPLPSATTPPTAVPSAGWLPPGTVALYAAGSWDNARLYALAADGSATDMDLEVYNGATASPAGRWIASPGGPPMADSSVISNLEDGTTYTVAATPSFGIYHMAFDSAETRLAFLEVGPPEGEATGWAIVVVNLADGSTARFEAAMGADRAFLPGTPIGWNASGGELIVDTFLPYSEGGFAGVWAIALPPDAAPAPLSTLARRELLPSWGYLSRPRLSPDTTRLLYPARDPDYMPADYEPVMMDLAVNQLQMVDLAAGTSTLLVETTDGGALASAAAWSPDGSEVLFAQGTYSGYAFASLGAKIRDGSGTVRDVGALPAPPEGTPTGLEWCTPDLAFYTVTTGDGARQLHTVDLAGGETDLITSADYLTLLGCVSR
jgi:hypothetical protein